MWFVWFQLPALTGCSLPLCQSQKGAEHLGERLNLSVCACRWQEPNNAGQTSPTSHSFFFLFSFFPYTVRSKTRAHLANKKKHVNVIRLKSEASWLPCLLSKAHPHVGDKGNPDACCALCSDRRKSCCHRINNNLFYSVSARIFISILCWDGVHSTQL